MITGTQLIYIVVH